MTIRLLNKNEDAKSALEDFFSSYEEEDEVLEITSDPVEFSNYELKMTHEKLNTAYITTIQDRNRTYKTP